MAAPSQTPVRYPTGVATDKDYQPLGYYGNRNPFFYHEWEDDFDGVNAAYTQTKTGNGTIAATAGDGGIALFTTNSGTPLATDLCSIQLPAASFSFTASKKSFFLCRLQVADAVNAAFNVGLMNTTATPFAPTDGLYFKKATGAATIVLASMVGSVETDIALPASAYTLANNTDIDLGWYVDRNQKVWAFIGSGLVGYQYGYVTQLGPNAAGTPSLTAAVLNFTIALQSGTATSKTMKVDFGMAAKER